MCEITRRLFSIGGAAVVASSLCSCAGLPGEIPLVGGLTYSRSRDSNREGATISRPNYAEVYGRYSGEQFPIPAFDYTQVDAAFLRQEVTYAGLDEPGTVVVDPPARQLYYVQTDHRATRYGVGVGREGFAWSGTAQINMRRSWPDWVPPREMVLRDPDIRSQLLQTARGQGIPGGPRSPLGARAMYLFAEGGDTGYRIHGTTEPETIGTNVSSGCIRMVNQDIIHLYGRAPDGSKVVVLA